jgi:hypothetical protein
VTAETLVEFFFDPPLLLERSCRWPKRATKSLSLRSCSISPLAYFPLLQSFNQRLAPSACPRQVASDFSKKREGINGGAMTIARGITLMAEATV